MKKLGLFALVLILTVALVLTAFQASVGSGDGYAAGWNMRRTMFNTSADPVQSVSFRIAPPWRPTPDAGWNS